MYTSNLIQKMSPPCTYFWHYVPFKFLLTANCGTTWCNLCILIANVFDTFPSEVMSPPSVYIGIWIIHCQVLVRGTHFITSKFEPYTQLKYFKTCCCRAKHSASSLVTIKYHKQSKHNILLRDHSEFRAHCTTNSFQLTLRFSLISNKICCIL